jgi:hypothetical protein
VIDDLLFARAIETAVDERRQIVGVSAIQD